MFYYGERLLLYSVISCDCSLIRKDSPEDLHTSPKGRPQDRQKPSFGVSRKKRHLHTLQQNASQVSAPYRAADTGVTVT